MHRVTHMPSTPGSQSNGTTLHQVNNVVHTKQKHGATNTRISWNEHCRPTTHGKQHNTPPQSASRKERCRPTTHGKQHNTLPQSASRKERCRPTTHGKQHNTLPQSASRKERCRPTTHGKQHNTPPQSASRKERCRPTMHGKHSTTLSHKVPARTEQTTPGLALQVTMAPSSPQTNTAILLISTIVFYEMQLCVQSCFIQLCICLTTLAKFPLPLPISTSKAMYVIHASFNSLITCLFEVN